MTRGQTVEVDISFDDVSIDRGIPVTPVGPDEYRLEVSPIFTSIDALYGDVIQAETRADGTLRFVRTLRRADLRRFDWKLPQNVADSAELRSFCDAIVAAGGMWEQVFDTRLLVHVPTRSRFDAASRFDDVVAACAARSPGDLTR